MTVRKPKTIKNKVIIKFKKGLKLQFQSTMKWLKI